MADQVKSDAPFPPLFDGAFLYIFGREDSKSITRKLINAVARISGIPEVGEIDSISAETGQPGGVECKTPRCDVVVVPVADTRVFDIESQGRHKEVVNKALFYAAKLISGREAVGSDEDYSELAQVVSITLLRNQVLFPRDGRFVHVAELAWRSAGPGEPGAAGDGASPGSGNLTLVVIEMDKLAKGYTADSEEVRSDESVALLYLLAKGYRDEGEREAIMGEFLTLKEFGERYGLAVGDPEVRRRYDLYVEGELEDRAVKRQAREEGLAEGRAEGLAEGRAEGLAEGRAEGLAEGRESLAARLREMGVDEGVLERALAETRG